MDKLKLPDNKGTISIIENTCKAAQYTLVLAHGAGAGMQHAFMEGVALGISELRGHVIRFNFPYMEQGRKSPGSPKPNIAAIGLMERLAKERYPDVPLILGGKSYGGRMSSHWVAENPGAVEGLIYFGFPLHAPGRDSKDRAAHLADIEIPQLFIQGTNDALANYELIREVVNECHTATLETDEHADHSFRVPKKLTGRSADDVIAQLVRSADAFAAGD